MKSTADLVAALRRAREAEAKLAAIAEIHFPQADEQGAWCYECGPFVTWPCASARAMGVTE